MGGDHPPAGVCAGDGATNPLLRGVLEAVTEQKRELQAAASQALAHVAGHIQPLAPPLLRQLLRALESPGFLARAELVPAFAHLAADGDCVEGSRGAGEVQVSVHHLSSQCPELSCCLGTMRVLLSAHCPLAGAGAEQPRPGAGAHWRHSGCAWHWQRRQARRAAGGAGRARVAGPQGGGRGAAGWCSLASPGLCCS